MKMKLMMMDFMMSMMWIFSGSMIKLCVQKMDMKQHIEIMKSVLLISNMFLFAFFSKITHGAAYNPLTVLSTAISADFSRFFFTIFARIPAQIMGSIVGVALVMRAFPEIGSGPRLTVDIHRGALTEGFLTFTIVIVSLGLARNIPGSFYMKTWIASVSKLTLHILGSDLTGGVMNPASVMGWAYARGEHITKEHILVYWLAPIEATLLAVWSFRLLFKPIQDYEKQKQKTKSD